MIEHMNTLPFSQTQPLKTVKDGINIGLHDKNQEVVFLDEVTRFHPEDHLNGEVIDDSLHQYRYICDSLVWIQNMFGYPALGTENIVFTNELIGIYNSVKGKQLIPRVHENATHLGDTIKDI
jgi:hypothetical protein